MSFKIIRNDITKVSADAIVNTANPMPVIGTGTDTDVYNAAGEYDLLAARQKIGEIERGKSAWTDSYHLKKNGVKYIIHTVGIPYNEGKNGEVDILRSCYASSLNMAKTLGCKSVAIPLLATGFYSFPKELGLQIAVDEISKFLVLNEIDVILVVYDKKSYLISEKLFDDIQNFIDENYENSFDDLRCEEAPFDRYCDFEEEGCVGRPEVTGAAFEERSRSVKKSVITNFKSNDIDDFIQESTDQLNFQNTLQLLIANKNLENSAVYTKAFIDRKFFSKIITNKNYIPKKMTVMALGLALELKLDEYEDFLASAGYAFMPSSKFDLIIKFCVMKGIYNLVEVDMILDSHGECCFAPD